MLRTTIISVDKFNNTATSCTNKRFGMKTNNNPVQRVLSLSNYPQLKIGDILKCEGSPYLTKASCILSNKWMMFKNKLVLSENTPGFRTDANAVKVGDNGYVLRPVVKGGRV